MLRVGPFELEPVKCFIEFLEHANSRDARSSTMDGSWRFRVETAVSRLGDYDFSESGRLWDVGIEIDMPPAASIGPEALSGLDALNGVGFDLDYDSESNRGSGRMTLPTLNEDGGLTWGWWAGVLRDASISFSSSESGLTARATGWTQTYTRAGDAGPTWPLEFELAVTAIKFTIRDGTEEELRALFPHLSGYSAVSLERLEKKLNPFRKDGPSEHYGILEYQY